ncbi:MAG: SCP2 sterol-binding domain-containing protein [Ardenticatenaceae bacterium]|nr:SCP2 sterol-binding domain-containing protein [Anaerolineales bacterium]MCB8921836.1 SCP2 sterol-binding domain-containing protein [Ardenticatenaceae bacterium]MCB8991006.1 SCP2 sterol-binding domain-containing protein [Ardenticatenaceae bacterium]MCB9005314.1 SCP2 sterol-binding domain-containing protein [Ardenticatenaceae bacterium]
MSIPFPSDEWVKALCTELNQSAAYKQAAAKWEGDLIFVIENPGGNGYLYMDLWHGECRNARQLDSNSEVNAEFQLAAPIATWKRVIQGQLDPIRALTGRQLKLKGNLMKIMKTPKAAIELVNCSKGLDTKW